MVFLKWRVLLGKSYIRKQGLAIGKNTVLRSGLATNPLGGMTEIVFATIGRGYISIGNNVGISNCCIRAATVITIEDNVFIGGDCKIYDTDFHSVDYMDRMESTDVNKQSAPVTIKEGAWIGGHSIILKGVTVGRRSVIGAGSVVTRNIPDNELWAGNPAKFIRKINI